MIDEKLRELMNVLDGKRKQTERERRRVETGNRKGVRTGWEISRRELHLAMTNRGASQ